jgi:hypothetical protein
MSEHRQRRCEQTLLAAQTRLKPLLDERADMAAQQASLQQLMASQRACGSSLSHPELMTLLRRQALLRRQLQNLALEQARVDEQRARIEGEVRMHQQERQVLLRKHMKFSGLQQRLARQQRLISLRREEVDIEELSRPSR